MNPVTVMLVHDREGVTYPVHPECHEHTPRQYGDAGETQMPETEAIFEYCLVCGEGLA